MHTQSDLPSLGAPFEGGFYAGQIRVAGALHALVVAPRAEGEHAPAPSATWPRPSSTAPRSRSST